MSLSCDNKNKIDIGIPAVSRRNQIRTFHMNDAAPNLPDHDFPFKNSRLTPAGYYILTQNSKRSKSVSPVRKLRNISKKRSLSSHSFLDEQMMKGKLYVTDDLGRKKIRWPRSGLLNLQVFPNAAIEATSSVPSFSFKNILSQHPHIFNLLMIVDGGGQIGQQKVL